MGELAYPIVVFSASLNQISLNQRVQASTHHTVHFLYSLNAFLNQQDLLGVLFPRLEQVRDKLIMNCEFLLSLQQWVINNELVFQFKFQITDPFQQTLLLSLTTLNGF